MTRLSEMALRSSALLAALPLRIRGRRRFICVINLLLLSLLVTPSITAADGKFRTLVSITLDDNNRQSTAIQSLLDTGLKATFYVNSNRIRLSGSINNNDYLTKGELDTLFNNGIEIGGHTIDHVNLATLSDAAQQKAICDDLATLRNWYGDQVFSFAYPFSSTGPTTQSIVANGCPGTYGPSNKPVGKYESARAVGGIGCTGCPFAESLPPHNPYYISTIGTPTPMPTLAEMQNLVTQTELNGGGWVTLVFHSVCDGCPDNFSVTPSTFRAFLDWLKVREPQGTYVRTVHQVMSGDYPAPPPPPPLGPNLLINPSLEQDQNNNAQPDCWQRDGFGTNTVTWTRTSDAFSGSFAQRVQITAFTNGDRMLVPTFDAGQAAGGCAPPIETGANYQISAYYKSNTTTTVTLFYLDANDVWQYWRDGPILPAATNWTQMIHYTGPLPAGAQALSFGIALTGIGTLTTDEYSMAKVLNAPPPNTAPTFTGGTTALTVTQNSPAVDLKPNLHVSDADAGQTETWSQSAAPAHGTLVITGATAASGSTNITPGGTITYQPAAGYTGSDSFAVRVSDGVASATRTFTVTVNPSSNLLINPSLEQDQDNNNQPDCWQRTGFGTNTVTWTRTTDAFSGSFAQQLQITAYTSGDRKLMPALDAGQAAGGCAPSVETGANYQISAYYKSNATSTVLLYYLDANGVWQYWRDGPVLAASNGWSQMVHNTGPLPSGAKALSFGIALERVGTLTTDEYAMVKVQNTPPPANTAPTFAGGTTTLTVAMNSPAVDLKPNLHVSDTDTGQTETWSQSAAPAHGTLVITGATAASGSTNITPGGTLTYQPAAGYSGSDSFAVRVSDGTASATRTFTVTVNPAANLLINSSLEQDQDNNNQPDCWQRTGFGTNTVTWTRTTDAFSGSFAQQLQITAYTSGDRKLMPALDAGQAAGGCAPSVDANGVYQISAYYKSTTTATVLLFYLNANNVWQYWRDGPVLAAASNWVQMVHDTGTLPAGAKALSFGIALERTGTLTTDEYSMVRVR